jgi:hypothetical protein
MHGKNNISVGLWVMALFMIYGFVLIYLRDFSPDKEHWIENYSVGEHFESRLAHVHGNLFAFLNVVIGYLILHYRGRLRHIRSISWLALVGLLMPFGILAEVYMGASPVFVLIGAISMTLSVLWLGFSFHHLAEPLHHHHSDQGD